jgi:hypothetical protein
MKIGGKMHYLQSITWLMVFFCSRSKLFKNSPSRQNIFFAVKFYAVKLYVVSFSCVKPTKNQKYRVWGKTTDTETNVFLSAAALLQKLTCGGRLEINFYIGGVSAAA